MNECIFCKIVAGEIPSLKVYEDLETVSFLELTPSAPGHAMVILKKHGNNILEYSKEELGSLMASVQHVTKQIEKGLSVPPDSITIGINHKEKKGVPHLHVHLIPRWENDGGHAIQGVVSHKPEESREVIAEKIRSAKV